MSGLPPYFMVFDVESVGLHGEGFAVGWVVIDRDGKLHATRRFACSPDSASGNDSGREWIKENCPEMESVRPTPNQIRDAFWEAWLYWKERGAVLVADCAWPVEARFLAACVDDDSERREWQGPYPLHELASFRLAADLDPLGTNGRLPEELPVHDPLADALQSARLLFEALDKITKDASPLLSIDSATSRVGLISGAEYDSKASFSSTHPANRPGASGFGGDG